MFALALTVSEILKRHIFYTRKCFQDIKISYFLHRKVSKILNFHICYLEKVVKGHQM